MAAHELEEVLLDEDRKQLEAEGKELSRDALTELYNRIYTASKIEHDLRYAWEIEVLLKNASTILSFSDWQTPLLSHTTNER